MSAGTSATPPPFRWEVEQNIARIWLNRPERRNPLALAGDGHAAKAMCDELNGDPAIRCAILTGDGSAFSAGGDIHAMRSKEGMFAGSGMALREAYRNNVHGIVRALYALDMPLIAAVNGPAVGLGCDIVCLADIRIAAATATFSVPFLKLGLLPGDGGAWLLPRAIGMSRAAELFFTGDSIDAETAALWGLVSRVVPLGRLTAEAERLAQKIASMPPHALRIAKSLMRAGQSASFDTLLEMSATTQALAHYSADHKEGIEALIDRRPPTFIGA
ncbi:crotonase/enoyl-CoA hydratase family protein [Sphingomonas vulcanisoli]|nr:crotonase/enoyl-CoA hydratase family protein [Sphingomonas vulcanisoli]